MNPRMIAVALFAVLCGLAQSGSAQRAGEAPDVYRNLPFTKLKEFSPGGLDSVVVVKPSADGVGIVVTYDNPCGVRPTGRYRLSSDTLFIVLRYKPAVSIRAACQGMIIHEAFAAHIKPLRASRYTVRVDLRGRLLPEGPVWRKVEVVN